MRVLEKMALFVYEKMRSINNELLIKLTALGYISIAVASN
jgi:hypothetical protein